MRILILRCLSFCLPVVLSSCFGPPLPEIPKTLPPSASATEPPAWESADIVAPERTAAPRVTRPYLDKGLRDISMGTGFFVSADGRLLTNNHVVAGCEGVSVETTDGAEILAEVQVTDPGTDLALVHVDSPAPAVGAFREKVRMDGRRVAVIGYPSRGLPRIRPTLVPAALIGPVTPDGRRFMLQGDIRPGNSGGPILDDNALVVGVVYGKINSVLVFQNTGRNVDDIGFAITNEAALSFLAKNGVQARTEAYDRTRDETALFDDGRRFIARVICWGHPGNSGH